MKKNLTLLTFILLPISLTAAQADDEDTAKQSSLEIALCKAGEAVETGPERLALKTEKFIKGSVGVVGVLGAGELALKALGTSVPTRGLVDTSILSSPLLWVAFGVLGTSFAGYHFIGKEMGIIVNTKGTLSKLEKEVEKWQALYPQLVENQQATDDKIKEALDVINAMKPLMESLSGSSKNDVTIMEQLVSAQQGLAELGEAVKELQQQQGQLPQDVKNAIKTKSKGFFGTKISKV